MSTIGIGIPVFNDYILTGHLLDSIFFYTERKDINRIIVIDDGSDKEYLAALKKVCIGHNVDLIENNENLGVSISWNKLVKELGTDYVILLNNDIVVWKGWFEAMKYALIENPEVGTVSLPTVLVARCDIHKVIQDGGDKRHIEILKPWNKMKRGETFNLPERRDPARVISPIGCSFGFSRKMFDLSMGFNETYKAFYEEVDFGISLYGLNYPSIILSSPHIYHVWGATFESNPQINAQQIMEDSRIKFVQKYGCDQLELYKRFKAQGKIDFESKVKYLDYKGEEKEVVLNYTWPPIQDCLIEL